MFVAEKVMEQLEHEQQQRQIHRRALRQRQTQLKFDYAALSALALASA